MIKKKLVQCYFCIKKTFLVYNFFRIFFSIILTLFIITASFFISDIKSIFADDNSKILICIDPGHGGKDCGTIGPTGLKEKDVNLDISIKLKSKLIDAGFKVILTRESDINHSVDEITNFANSNNVDLFISVHNNSHPSPDMNGTQTFYFNQSPGGNLLANYLNAAIIGQIGTINRGVKTANFVVLKNTKMVSALVEGVFMCNPNEEAELKDSNFRDKIATGIYNGIIEYLKNYSKTIISAKRLASAQSFVKRIYQKSLNTDPDQATINSWADKLAAVTITHADVIRGIIISKQFNDRKLTDSQYVDVLYKAVLDRDPESNGAAYWLDQLKKISRKAVLEYFLTSPEFTAMLNQYNQYGYNYTGTINNTAAEMNTSDTTASETAFGLSILNGVGVKGIAAKTSGLLKEIKDSEGKYKYHIDEVTDASNYNYKNTQIICKSKDSGIMKAAEEIKTKLKVGIISIRSGTPQNSDIVIIIGKDYLSTAGTATSTTNASEASKLILVNILNGQGTQGIAAKVKSKIGTDLSKYKDIIEITEAKNADNFNYKSTRIIIFTTKTGIDNIAGDLKKLLGVGEISKSTSNIDNVDITIILGSDYKK
jgi:N-acetylmuramoyl-L-alanine amidase